MSNALRGKPKPWLRGRKRPEHSRIVKEWWTPERREQKRQEMLARYPDARYHGLSCKGARRLREAMGHCERCGSDGSDSRLDVHHRNGNKRDQTLANLVVLCHRCHMQLHSEQGDLKRKTNLD
jgi:5-methylcytosine-specific restriction endonuclease McrA